MTLLDEAEAHLRRAEEAVQRDASPENLRRLEYWRARVRALREQAG